MPEAVWGKPSLPLLPRSLVLVVNAVVSLGSLPSR